MIPPLPTFSLDGHQDLDCYILEGSSTNSTSANNSPAPEPENASSSSPDESRSSGGRFRFVVCFKEKGKGVLVMSLLKVIVLLAQSPLRAPEGYTNFLCSDCIFSSFFIPSSLPKRVVLVSLFTVGKGSLAVSLLCSASRLHLLWERRKQGMRLELHPGSNRCSVLTQHNHSASGSTCSCLCYLPTTSSVNYCITSKEQKGKGDILVWLLCLFQPFQHCSHI